MITAEQPQVATTGRYSMTQAAKVLGIHPVTLLRHVKQGRLRYSTRRTTGRKYFSGYELLKYWRSY